MSDCERAMSMINEYIDGELETNEAKFVLSHIRSCPDCKKIYDELIKINELISGSCEEAPNDLSVLIMDKIRNEKKRRTAKLIKIGSLVSVAAVLVLLISSPLISFFMSGGATAEMDSVNDVKFDPSLSPEAADDVALSDKADSDYLYGADMEMPETEATYIVTVTAILNDGTKAKLVLDYNYKTARLNSEKYKFTKDGKKMILSNNVDEIIFEIKDENTVYETDK